MSRILIAGGTGLIGKAVTHVLEKKGHEVLILTRSPKTNQHIHWEPSKNKIDTARIDGTECLINLCGENIGNERWSAARKKELYSSRIQTTEFLFDTFKDISSLKQYISASGINCYPLEMSDSFFSEDKAFGKDYLAQLVYSWENAADLFEPITSVAKMRISMVLDKNDGALQKLIPLAKWGVAAPLGSGKQWMNWIHINDLANAFAFAAENQLSGAFNITGTPVSNTYFTKALCHALNKKMFFLKVPAFVLKLVLGQQSTIVLDGVRGDNRKLKQLGFNYEHEEINEAMTQLLG